MGKELVELNQKQSDFIETIRNEFSQTTGKELEIENVIQVITEALRESSEELGIDVFVKSVDISGVINRV